ncbi:pilus assembly protein [Marinobacter lacisalsi]|uniref:Pilus assembly protein n=1 Tax=Marinobacter lacisalsi TaxID=475979 RepID=A0ABV8QIH7_9GAMM
MKQRINKMKALRVGRLQHGLIACLFGIFTFNSALAGPINIADFPPSLGGNVSPNVVFIIDDSGSMNFEYIPDDLNDHYAAPTNSGEDVSHKYYYSPKVNFIYYNPDVTYRPPFKADATGRMANSSYTSAWRDGYSGSDKKDLSDDFQVTWVTLTNAFDGITGSGSNTFTDGGFYYKYDPSATDAASCEGDPEQNKCYRYVSVNGESAEQQQNFANWYSYYRTRLFTARASIGEAFDELDPSVRLGWGSINTGLGTRDSASVRAVRQGVRPYEDSHRQTFYNWLYSHSASGGTPLRRALEGAGRYYENSAAAWADDPNNPSSGEKLECRQSFTILMTDGLWNGSDPSNLPTENDVDSHNGPVIVNPNGADYQFKADTDPFADDQGKTLADVAMHYWNRDLRDDIANKVPTSGRNPAFWQHMVSYGVGFGVTGSDGITPESAFNAISTGSNVPWGSTSTPKGKIDDLLHAAVNSRGGYFNASDPTTLATALSGILQDMVSRVEQSTTAAAASSAVFRQGALSYSAGFRSTDWSGAVQATQILSGGARGKLIWDAERELESKGHGARKLYTYTGSAAVSLNSLGDLSASQQTALNTALDGTADGLGADRIDWLRGDNGANVNFRDREFQPEGSTNTYLRLIGDIIGSNPQYAGKTNFGFRRLPGSEGTSYATFRADQGYQDRPDVIYVGANDGFLHAFNSLTGEELFAYMPGEFLEPENGNAYAAVNELMSQQYDHKYFVDGTPVISDAYINGQWKTILVGTTGVGGKTVFALDITDPESFSASDVLWEFTHEDLGYGVSDARIVRLSDAAGGKWAAVFGNGYNSLSNESSLFLVDLEDGSLINQLSTGEGDAAAPNGMAAPVVMADRTTGMAVRAYAGDLHGNLWRFSIDSNSPKTTKMFEATDGSGAAQPITAAPQVAYVPQGSNTEVVVVFGTGSFFRTTDIDDSQYQSLYGVYDDGKASGLDRGDLLTQTIETQSTANYMVQNGATTETQSLDIRIISDNAMGATDKGWHMDLDTSSGERVVSPAGFPSGYPVTRVRFSTLIPETNVCSTGQEGYIMDLDLLTGGQTENAVFDLNRDGEYGAGDAANSQVVNGVRNVLSGERISVIMDRGTDLFLDSEILDVPEEYDGPEEPDPEPEPDPDDPDDPDPTPPCTGPLCGDAEDLRFGRQNWEELR